MGELGSTGPMKQIVLTKTDMVARSDLTAFKRVEHKLLMVSSVTEAGLHDLRMDIMRRCGRAQEKKASATPAPSWSPPRKLPSVLPSMARDRATDQEPGEYDDLL